MDPELFLIIPKGHPLSDKNQLDLHEVARDPFILFKPETALYDVIEKLFKDAGFHPVMSFEAFDERTVAGLVGANLGVAHIPFFPGIDREKVSLVHVGNPHCSIGIQMVFRTSGYTSPAFEQFKTYVENALSLG